MLATLSLTASQEHPGRNRPRRSALVVVVLTGLALVYATFDMPRYGDPDAPIHHHVADHYLEETDEEIGVPNIVTAVLASYRGYDTWGETTVIFTACVGVLLLLGGARTVYRRLKPDQEAGGVEVDQ
jgi:multicomponent Na+:H+ antiporter subunit B